jgi:hypothetical protein
MVVEGLKSPVKKKERAACESAHWTLILDVAKRIGFSNESSKVAELCTWQQSSKLNLKDGERIK